MPRVLVSEDAPEDAEDLVDLRITWEQRRAHCHFGKDAADRPHINCRVIVTGAKEHFRCTVPQCHNLVGIGAQRDTKCTRKTKVGKLEIALLVDKQVLRLEVTVQYTVRCLLYTSPSPRD